MKNGQGGSGKGDDNDMEKLFEGAGKAIKALIDNKGIANVNRNDVINEAMQLIQKKI
jgi:hypothetical protein